MTTRKYTGVAALSMVRFPEKDNGIYNGQGYTGSWETKKKKMITGVETVSFAESCDLPSATRTDKMQMILRGF